MISGIRYSLCALTAVLCITIAAAESVLLDDCRSSSGWIFEKGAEFPGAAGSIAVEGGRLALNYDFTGGGAYVAAVYTGSFPLQAESLQLKISSAADSKFSLRVTDSAGRVFQSQEFSAAAKDTVFQLDLKKQKWASAWGGSDKNAKQPEAPLKKLWICAGKASAEKKGVLYISSLEAVAENGSVFSPSPLIRKDQSFSACGYRLNLSWSKKWNYPLLLIEAVPEKASPGTRLSVDFPQNGRDLVKRFELNPSSVSKFEYLLPVTDGGNPFNSYKIIFAMDNGKESFKGEFSVDGISAPDVLKGNYLESSAIAESSFGTCVHFAYGTNASFGIWKDYRKLTDMIAAAGFKWIRDGAKIDKESGNVRDYDLEWIKYAKSKGISTILVIDMGAGDSLEQFTEKCRKIVTQTAGLVNVFELGNEPNNFGNWRKTYSGPDGKEGTWNGRNPDNSTADWVLAHLKYTNAGAEAIKAVRPDAVVLGTGAAAPTNLRYLDAGLSKAVDGLVEHPYSFALPPEKVPFSLKLEKRDGVKVGDMEGSFKALIESYFKKFKETGVERSLWVTEFGFTSYWFNGKNEKGLYAGYSEEAQAAYIARRFLLSMTLPIAVTCQYDFIDDYGSMSHEAEANFGLLRSDYSEKPAYLAMRRLNTLMDTYKYDPNLTVKLEKDSIHRAMMRSELIKNWDEVSFDAANGVMAYGFKSSGGKPAMIAVWSLLPYSGEFNSRAVALRVKGAAYASRLTALDILSGRSFDLSCKKEGEDLIVDGLILEQHPLVIILNP